MTTQTRAAWIFGSLFVAFVFGVFVFGPSTLTDFQQRILAFICALLAGLFALFFTGSLLLKAELPMPGKWGVQGATGFALFLIVLFWWSQGLVPAKSAVRLVKLDSGDEVVIPLGEYRSFKVVAADATGSAVGGKKVMWTTPAGGSKAYIGVTNNNGVSGATNLYSFTTSGLYEQDAKLVRDDSPVGFVNDSRSVSAVGPSVKFTFFQPTQQDLEKSREGAKNKQDVQ